MKLTQTYIGMFITNDPTTGEPSDADSTPVITVYKNGEINTDIILTATEPDPSNNDGIYQIVADDTWENSSFTVDDKVDIYVYATINSINSHAFIDSFTLDNGTILASDGLDNISITEPSGRASNFREMIVQLYNRFFNKVTLDNDNLKVYTSGGSINTTQSVSDSGTTQTVNKA